jgi:membrane fusion protein, multidrug efflux system
MHQNRLFSPRIIFPALIGLGLLVWIGLRIVGNVSGGGGGRRIPAGDRGVPVRIATATIDDVGVTSATIGTVLANATVAIKSRVDGRLLSAGFREGQLVKAGEVLFRIDPAPFETAMHQAQAAVTRDQAQLNNAQSNMRRSESLLKQGAISAQSVDQVVAEAQAAAATVVADEAAVEQAKLQLGYTEIRSPIDGKTGSILIHPGNLVKANDTNPLVVIAQTQPVKISFSLPQGDLPAVQDRMRTKNLVAQVSLRSSNGSLQYSSVQADDAITVPVDFVGNAVDNNSGTIELRATFNNPDMRLVPGELVDVRVQLNTLHKVVQIPHDAVNQGPNGAYVYVLSADNKAQMRTVKVLYDDEVIAAVGAGVAEGDRVVTEGQLRLTPGASASVVAPD